MLMGRDRHSLCLLSDNLKRELEVGANEYMECLRNPYVHILDGPRHTMKSLVLLPRIDPDD